MKLLKLRPSKQSIFGLAGVLVLLAVACVGLFIKQQASLSVVRAELEGKEKQLAEGNALASRLESTLKMLQSDRERLKFLEATLPTVAYVPTLLRQVEDLAIETHNTVRGVRPTIEAQRAPRKERRADPDVAAAAESEGKPKKEEKKEPEPYNRLKIQLAITGEYQHCLTFIQKLTRFPKIIAVEDVQLRPKFDLEGGKPEIDVDLNLTAFILNDRPNQKLPELPEETQAT